MKSFPRFHNICLVNVLSKRGLRELTARHPGIEAEALTWYRVVAAAERSCIAEFAPPCPPIWSARFWPSIWALTDIA